MPFDFLELTESMNNNHGYLFFKYLIKIMSSLENRAPCYILGIHKADEVGKMALQIMQGGLKADITKQQVSTICKEKMLFVDKLRYILLLY